MGAKASAYPNPGKVPPLAHPPMKKYTYSYQIDGYLIQTATVEASTGKEARDKIRASHKGRKVSSFIPA
jgi:hypothetical protein